MIVKDKHAINIPNKVLFMLYLDLIFIIFDKSMEKYNVF